MATLSISMEQYFLFLFSFFCFVYFFCQECDVKKILGSEGELLYNLRCNSFLLVFLFRWWLFLSTKFAVTRSLWHHPFISCFQVVTHPTWGVVLKSTQLVSWHRYSYDLYHMHYSPLFFLSWSNIFMRRLVSRTLTPRQLSWLSVFIHWFLSSIIFCLQHYWSSVFTCRLLSNLLVCQKTLLVEQSSCADNPYGWASLCDDIFIGRTASSANNSYSLSRVPEYCNSDFSPRTHVDTTLL